MYKFLESFNKKDELYNKYTTIEMWNDPYISEQMLEFHLNPDLALASRTKDFINSSVEFLIEKFQINQNTSLIDFGCGPGLYTSRLAETGAKVTGIDASLNSINYAKKQNKLSSNKINYINGDYLKFKPKNKFDLAMMVFCDFCVLNPTQRKKLLSVFKSSLKESGYLILDLFTNKFFDNMPEETNYEHNPDGGFWTPSPYHMFYKSFKYEEEKTLLMKYAIIEENRNRMFYNYLKSYTLDLVKQEFDEAGFTIVNSYANIKGDCIIEESDTICVVAQLK